MMKMDHEKGGAVAAESSFLRKKTMPWVFKKMKSRSNNSPLRVEREVDEACHVDLDSSLVQVLKTPLRGLQEDEVTL